ncbi:MAG: hypothetical protein MUF38_18700 [Anaerolineae bacterium]|nr:hypothetical protein [Anaerolineae bacterium]
MTDQPPPHDDETNPPPRRTRSRSGDLPASMIFTEMVRQAALNPPDPTPAPPEPVPLEIESRLFNLPIAPETPAWEPDPEPLPDLAPEAPEVISTPEPVAKAADPLPPAKPIPTPAEAARLDAERVRRVRGHRVGHYGDDFELVHQRRLY